MNTELVTTVVISIIGSSALWSFIQFIIGRRDARMNKHADIMDALEILSEKMCGLEAKMDEREAIHARIRILRFADELLEDKRHSKESFDQILSDITTYEHYCSLHPEFHNNQTEATVEYIRKLYTERLEKKDFLKR